MTNTKNLNIIDLKINSIKGTRILSKYTVRLFLLTCIRMHYLMKTIGLKANNCTAIKAQGMK
jgi:hypothetical protein